MLIFRWGRAGSDIYRDEPGTSSDVATESQLRPPRDDPRHRGDVVHDRVAPRVRREARRERRVRVLGLVRGVLGDVDRARAKVQRAQDVLRQRIADVDELRRRAARGGARGDELRRPRLHGARVRGREPKVQELPETARSPRVAVRDRADFQPRVLERRHGARRGLVQERVRRGRAALDKVRDERVGGRLVVAARRGELPEEEAPPRRDVVSNVRLQLQLGPRGLPVL
mmetsp:Transcript_24744/g.76313  ORF Transcript_24744/g.76313 Transcript_24744/m.76313 type:complete len:228 (-) Transcript_24744:680-1363(-)